MIYTGFDAMKDLAHYKLRGNLEQFKGQRTPARDLATKYNPFANPAKSDRLPEDVQRTSLAILEHNVNVVCPVGNTKLRHFLVRNNSSDPEKLKRISGIPAMQLKSNGESSKAYEGGCINSARTARKEAAGEEINLWKLSTQRASIGNECVLDSSSDDQEVSTKNISELHRKPKHTAILLKPDSVKLNKRAAKISNIEKLITNVQFPSTIEIQRVYKHSSGVLEQSQQTRWLT